MNESISYAETPGCARAQCEELQNDYFVFAFGSSLSFYHIYQFLLLKMCIIPKIQKVY